MKNVPRYEDLIAQQTGTEIPENLKLEKGQVLDCLGQTHCFGVPGAIREERLTQTLKDLEELFGNADHLPDSYRLHNHGNIIREEFRNKKLSEEPVVIFVAGTLLFALPNAMKFMDASVWLHPPAADSIGIRRYKRRTGKDPNSPNRSDALNKHLAEFLQRHRDVDLKVYSQSLKLQHEVAELTGAFMIDASPKAPDVLEAATCLLDQILLTPSKEKWEVLPVPEDKREEAERARAKVELEHGEKKKTKHELPDTVTGLEDTSSSPSAAATTADVEIADMKQDTKSDSVMVTRPNNADAVDSSARSSDRKRVQSPTPDPLGAFASLPRDGRNAPIVRRANLSPAQADAEGVAMHVDKRARLFPRKNVNLLPARWVVKKPDPSSGEEEREKHDKEQVLLDQIRQCTLYEGRFKEDATRWIRENVEGFDDPNFAVTARQTYGAADFAAGKLAKLSFTDEDETRAIFGVASQRHWKQYIKEVASTGGVSVRMWKRITRNRIRAQRHQLAHICHGTQDRLFFYGCEIPYDPENAATPKRNDGIMGTRKGSAEQRKLGK